MEDGDHVEREVRAARNQAVFREVNERLESLGEAFQLIAEGTSFACECADLSCLKEMSLSLAEYEGLRNYPNRFAVLPGNVYPDVERVVAESRQFVVVEKIGKGAEIAAASDPRLERARLSA